ncbi:MAG: 16S rRNA (guanine(527)-N(7))-methyltransferase RsmG [Candidatus Peribacteraceae bacterium]|nr:16S rRNA (guanine(527)-N(7))-methyltransferase RsmG [Candidatus Peribacteraceae bacterium]
MTDPALEPRLRQLLTVFLEENKKLNLSAFRTEEQCWIGNILDSLAALELPFLSRLLPHPPSPSPNGGGGAEGVRELLDLGTGGGFPLLPLAIALPDVRFTGLDSVQKKVDAVNRMIGTLALPNARCVCGRAEELGRSDAYRERFDVVTSRAVSDVNVLLEYASPFVKPGGRVVLWKSVTIDQELHDSLLARAELSCHLIHQHVYELPGDWGKRQLLVFEKSSPLSGKYPRDIGVPKKDPLK